MNHRYALMATLCTALAACDKPAPTTTPPPGDDAGGAPADGGAVAGDDGAAAADGGGDTEPGAPSVAWADKTFEQRKTWMGIEVFPKMKTAFQGHDATQFKSFTCETCHGDGAKEKNYAMPNDSIYPLPKDDPIKAAMEYDDKIAKFMVNDVVPQMATMLSTQPASAENPTGLSCFGCHPTE
jgi:hypothetical protein